MEKIPTAEELMQSKNGDDYTHWEEIHEMLIEFAKLHVQQALKEASVKASVYADEGGYTEFVDEYSILDSYPLDKIK
jgi:hypothetical protein